MRKYLSHQPSGLVEVNDKSPFMKRLVGLCHYNHAGFTELLSRVQSTPYSSTGTSPPTATRAAAVQAIGRRNNIQAYTTSNDATTLCRPWPVNSYFTIMALGIKHAGGSNGKIFQIEDNLGGFVDFRHNDGVSNSLQLNSMGGWSANRAAETPSGTYLVGKPYVHWGRHRSSDGYVSVALDRGEEYLSTTGMSVNNDGTSIKFISSYNSSTATPVDWSIFLAAVWSYSLSRAEQIEITNNPWDLIKPVERKIYIQLSPYTEQPPAESGFVPSAPLWIHPF